MTCNCRDLQLSHFIAPASSLVRRTCGETLPAGRCPGWWKRLCTRGRRRSSNWTRPRAGWAAARTPAPAAPRRVPGDRSRAASMSAAARWRLSAGRVASWCSAVRQVSSEDLNVSSLCVGRRRRRKGGREHTVTEVTLSGSCFFFLTLRTKWHRKNMREEKRRTICWHISKLAAHFCCCCCCCKLYRPKLSPSSSFSSSSRGLVNTGGSGESTRPSASTLTQCAVKASRSQVVVQTCSTQLVVMWLLTAPSCERQRRSADSSRGVPFFFSSPLFLYSEKIVTRTAAVWSLNRAMIAHEEGNVLTVQPPLLPVAQSKKHNVPAQSQSYTTSSSLITFCISLLTTVKSTQKSYLSKSEDIMLKYYSGKVFIFVVFKNTSAPTWP